jgi:hypothetical protein
MSEEAKNPRELVDEMIRAFESLKTKINDPNYNQLENSISLLIESQKQMKDDISDLKKQLLNPYDGVVVETRKNSEIRKEWEEWHDEKQKLFQEHKELMTWKASVMKLFWMLITGVGGIIGYMLTNWITHIK